LGQQQQMQKTWEQCVVPDSLLLSNSVDVLYKANNVFNKKTVKNYLFANCLVALAFVLFILGFVSCKTARGLPGQPTNEHILCIRPFSVRTQRREGDP
jgi:hypothetical protein